MNKQKILFITTSSLSSNPRLVKELLFFKKENECHVVSFIHNNWTLEIDKEFFLKHDDIKFYSINRANQKTITLLSKLIKRFSKITSSLLTNSILLKVFASNELSFELYYKLIKLNKTYKFSRVLGHNLGAFYPSYKLSKWQNIPLQLDVEDYHPGEKTYNNHKKEIENRKKIMQFSFLNSEAITFASKGIYEKCNKVFSIPKNIKLEVILNSFSENEFLKEKQSKEKKIKCVWFSQHISHSRGLEQLFEVSNMFSEIEFHLIGNINEDYISQFILKENIIFHKPMSQENLHKLISKMDIGLALENENADENRGICLTNKILAYAQAGLYILATDTYGQRDFMSQLQYKAGEIITVNLQTSLANFDRSFISYESKIMRWENAKSFSWEKEKLKLFKVI